MTPDMPVDHVERDLKLCEKLISSIYDKEREIKFPFDKMDEIESPSTKLDTYVVYLRQVHGYCFFSGVKCDDERALAAKCSPQYLRQHPSVERALFDTSPLYGSAKQFETNYVQAAEKIIKEGPTVEELVDPLEDEFLKSMKEEYCFNKTKEVQEGRKYSCKLCQKAFKSPDFVVKHIKNKHDDRLNEKFNYVYFRG